MTRRLPIALALALLLLSGCLGEPEIEDRWTRLDFEGVSLAPGQPVAPGSTVPISGRMAITYRRILTGVAVAELRASPTLSPGEVVVHPDAPRPRMAQDIDRVLASSVTMGRATRMVTGWDHLIQKVDFAFQGVVPAGPDSTGAYPGLFLLCYLGSGVEVEQPDGSDSLVVTPFPSTPYEILPIGMELIVGPVPRP